MPIDWKAVIADKAKYPDTAEFELMGEKLTFGELRRQNAASQGEIETRLNARESELNRKQQMQEQAVTTLANVLDHVSKVTGLTYDQLVKGEIPANLRETVTRAAGETRTPAGVPLREDPLYKPLFDEAIAPMSKDVDLLKRTLGTAISAYGNDHTRLAFLDYMMSGDKPADFKPKFEDALQLAVNKGYKEEGTGFPDVTRALREMAGPIQAKAEKTSEYERGLAEGRKQAERDSLALLTQPSPGTGGISFESKPDHQPGTQGGHKVQSIREKLNEAFNDPEIARQMFGGTATVQ